MFFSHKKSKTRYPKLYFSFLTFIIFSFFSNLAYAAGLEKAKGVLALIETEILVLIPILAGLSLAGMGIGFAMGAVRKETFMKWAIGLIIAGSAAQITAMLFI